MTLTRQTFWGLLLTCLMVASINAAQLTTEREFVWPDHQVSHHFKGFLAAYNANSSARMTAFIRSHGNPKDAQSLADYWMSVFAEYDELTPFSIDDNWSAEQRLAIWLKGVHTQAWVMILLSADPDTGKLTGKGVLRGQRPPVAVPPYRALTPTELAASLNSHIDSMADKQMFSGSLVLAKGKQVLLQKAVGLADQHQTIENRVSTVFNSASVTKLLTAVAIVQLVEQGKVKLGDTLEKWIPDYPKDIARQVTVQHLLTHTSGIELDNYAPFNRDVQSAKSVDEVIAAHVRHINHMNEGRRKHFKVLGQFDYSNENFHLLGSVIEQASGMPYLTYIARGILRPAGMYDALAFLTSGKDHAVGYTRRDEHYLLKPELTANTAFLPQFVLPSGGLYVSASDLHLFFLALNNQTLIREDSLKNMLAVRATEYQDDNVKLAYGLGVSLEQYGSAYAWGHSGALQGAGAQSWYFPEQDMYVMVLGNQDAIASQHLMGWVRDNIAPLP